MIPQEMKMSHANFPEVTRMVFINVRSMMMLTTCHSSTTGVLAMLADAAVAGGDMTPTFFI